MSSRQHSSKNKLRINVTHASKDADYANHALHTDEDDDDETDGHQQPTCSTRNIHVTIEGPVVPPSPPQAQQPQPQQRQRRQQQQQATTAGQVNQALDTDAIVVDIGGSGSSSNTQLQPGGGGGRAAVDSRDDGPKHNSLDSRYSDDSTQSTSSSAGCCSCFGRRSGSSSPNFATAHSSHQQKLGYPKERLKTLLATLGTILALTANLFALAIIHDFVSWSPASDLVFWFVPQQPWAWQVGDPMVLVLLLAVLTVVLLHDHRWLVWRRWAVIAGTLYTLRVICLAFTQFPATFEDNAKYCRPQLNHTDPWVILKRVAQQAFLIGLQGNLDGYLCGDVLFSGHTVQYSLCAFMIHQYAPKSWRWLRRFVTVFAMTGMLFMVISRTHYTVDVLVAYWLTTTIFSVYHSYVHLPHAERRRSPLRRLWFTYALDYFEAQVPCGRIENTLSWPLPRPHFMREFILDVSHRSNRDPSEQSGFTHRKIEQPREETSSAAVSPVIETNTVAQQPSLS